MTSFGVVLIAAGLLILFGVLAIFVAIWQKSREKEEAAKSMNEKRLYEILAAQGIRIFNLEIRPDYETTYIHSAKTMQEWRADVRRIIAEIVEETIGQVHSDNIVYNLLLSKMRAAGYMEVDDLVSDTYEGALDASVCIKDQPIHSDQVDGFGHRGWET